MKRTVTFAGRPLSGDGEQLRRELLDASAALWNEINYDTISDKAEKMVNYENAPCPNSVTVRSISE
ncbi:hypothetical protein AMS69_08775 [Haloarcula rubripromontorii]|uniref:Uncharacterized protein n=1 Tax=Haloarcula rubripromontorii TaxID=1705562 RepID=A0A0N0BPJ0_9EURY|nr:hypothetical protein [Haloarcula rubripromontorii]KOX94000.1 hypothetical protein AMS69_08775 [Haloarcula rubripromontorii]